MPVLGEGLPVHFVRRSSGERLSTSPVSTQRLVIYHIQLPMRPQGSEWDGGDGGTKRSKWTLLKAIPQAYIKKWKQAINVEMGLEYEPGITEKEEEIVTPP